MDELRTKINNKLEKNLLFQKSTTPFKYLQGKQYFRGDALREGAEAEKCNINGKLLNVIFTYKNGYLQSIDNYHAIQWDGH